MRGLSLRLRRVIHTARYLKLKQIIYRLYYGIRKARPVSVDHHAKKPDFSPWYGPSYRKPCTTDGYNFVFLGRHHNVKNPDDWSKAELGMLWLFNLHYLEDLTCPELSFELKFSVLHRWMRNNPPGVGVGWHPYTLSLRIVSMVKWLSQAPHVEQRFSDSLAIQASSLSDNIEYHILGNHVIANGKALVFAGSYLSGLDAKLWLAKGLKILDEQLPEQFLPDGAHFELSPMYHALLLWDLCDLILLSTLTRSACLNSRVNSWKSVVERGLHWLRSMLHPDGDISFFNDAAFGVAPSFSVLAAYAKSLGINSCFSVGDLPYCKYHADSGYFEVIMGVGHKALLDLAKVGPDYQPGHAHADTLSFELSLFGQRIFVNSGTSQYGDDQERHRQRSTAAHNTVEIDEENSSEVWAGFRVARRAFPVLEEMDIGPEKICIRACHTGYRRLKGKNLHRREWRFEANTCHVLDEITGSFGSAVFRLHVHPDVIFRWEGIALIAVLDTGKRIRVVIEGASSVTLQPASWHPEFGSKIPCQCIAAEFSSSKLVTQISWSGSV
jgi:uncharacterized heparinase superfamily protein